MVDSKDFDSIKILLVRYCLAESELPEIFFRIASKHICVTSYEKRKKVQLFDWQIFCGCQGKNKVKNFRVMA